MYDFFYNCAIGLIISKKIFDDGRKSKKSVFLQPLTDGALAQLARVSDWQSGGHGSDSRMLHKYKRLLSKSERFFVSLMRLFKLDLLSVIKII